MASTASNTLHAVVEAPKGKPITVQTFTEEPASSPAANAT